MSAERIIGRIARALAEGDVVEGLAEGLSPTDLQSLMLHVYSERSARRTPAELLAQVERTAMLKPSPVDARALLEVERVAYDCAAAFEALELSPVAPLGINRVLGDIDQNSCLATVRGAEVSADPTTMKALECARRRKAGETGTLRLCARSRQLRLQPVDFPGYFPHFALFSMVTAGRDRGSLAFEMESLREHIGVYLSLLRALGGAGYRFGDVRVEISETSRDADRLRRAEAGVLAPLASQFPEATFVIDTKREQAMSYYSGYALFLRATDATGLVLGLADGGLTTWTQRLLSNAKERLLVSGIGIELIVKRFRADAGGG